MMHGTRSFAGVLAAVFVAGGCGGSRSDSLPARAGTPEGGETAATLETRVAGLAGTAWRLVEIQSMDDAIGTKRPDNSSLYTMRLGADGTATFRMSGNRAAGALERDELVQEAPAIVGRLTPSALAHTPDS
jgi:hypothetical protein